MLGAVVVRLMSALATQIIESIRDTLQAAYPNTQVYTRKGKPGPDPSSPSAGWTPGMQAPAFVVSMNDNEPVDEYGTFEIVTVGYPGQISYVKPAAQEPGQWQEDPDVRTIQEDVRQLLYMPWLLNIGVMVNVDLKMEHSYLAFAGTVRFFPLLTFLFTGEETRTEL